MKYSIFLILLLSLSMLTGASGQGLTVSPGTGISISAGTTTAVSGNFILESNATANATLINEGTLSTSGEAQVQRYMSESVWHLMSSPVTAATSAIFEGDYLQYWDESIGGWVEITSTTETLDPGQGYSLWAKPGKSNTTYTFSGNLNAGNMQQLITYNTVASSEYDGANLLGNPYASYLDWSQVDDVFGAVYYWNGSAYVAYPAGTGSYGTGSQYVPPMQGFFIVIDPENLPVPMSFTFTSALQTHTAGDVSYYKENGCSFPNGLMLYADNGSYQDQLLIRLNDAATANMDHDRDAWKFPSNTPGLAQLWSVCPDGNLSIDVRPATDVIQLGFANDVAGTYTIGINEIAYLNTAILEDTKTNIFHDLTKGNFEFVWDVADNEKRFKLHLNAVGIEETPDSESNILIYAANNQIFIKGAEAGQVKVCDLMGRVILQDELSVDGSIRLPDNLQTSIYLVTVQNGKEVKTGKIFIK